MSITSTSFICNKNVKHFTILLVFILAYDFMITRVIFNECVKFGIELNFKCKTIVFPANNHKNIAFDNVKSVEMSNAFPGANNPRENNL